MKANQKFRTENGGEMSAGSLITLVILALIASAAIPIAITGVNDANTTGWTAGEVALWSIVGVVIIAVFVVAFANRLSGGGT